MKVKSESEITQLSPTLSDLQPTRLLCPWDFPGESTGVGCHCLLSPLLTFDLKKSAISGAHCPARQGGVGAGADWRSGWGCLAAPSLPRMGACSAQDPRGGAGRLPAPVPRGGCPALVLLVCVCVCVYCDFAKYSRTRDRKSWSPRRRERSFWFKRLLGALEVFQRHHRKNRN